MRIIAAPAGLQHYDREILTRDVLMVPDLFCQVADLAIYDKVRLRLRLLFIKLAFNESVSQFAFKSC